MLIIAGLGALFAGFLALFWLTPLGVPALKQFGGGQPSPDLRFGYRADETYRLLDLYGPRGIAHWRRMLWLDMVFPGVYAALFALLGEKWAQFADAGPIWETCAIGFPIAAGVSDYIENILLLGVIEALPRRRDAAIAGASLFTQAKFILSHAVLAIPLIHWVVGLVA
jgi:hypothetical protein